MNWTKNENLEKIQKARGLARALLARAGQAYNPRPEASRIFYSSARDGFGPNKSQKFMFFHYFSNIFRPKTL